MLRQIFGGRLKLRRKFTAFPLQLRGRLLQLRKDGFAPGDLLIDRRAKHAQRFLRVGGNLGLRVADEGDPLLKHLLHLPPGSLGVFPELLGGKPGRLLDHRFRFLAPSLGGLFQVGIENPAPTRFSDRGRGGDLVFQGLGSVIHLRQARLGFGRALVHLFLPETQFVRRGLLGA